MVHRVYRSSALLPALLGTALVLASCDSGPTDPGGGGGGGGGPTVTGVTITTPGAAMVVDATLQLTAAVAPTTAPQTVTWSSSDPNLATVSGSGLVTARNPGTVMITATSAADSSLSDSRQLQLTCPPPRMHTTSIVNAALTWENWISSHECLDYVSTTNVDVNAVLTIEPGTVVGFDDRSVRVNSAGTLIAAGTAENPIRLTRATPQARWRSLTLRSPGPNNRLEHAIIEYAGVNSVGTENGRPAALALIETAATTLRSVTVRESAGYGLFLRHTATVIGGSADNLVLTGNASGPAYVYSSVAHFILGAPGVALTGNDRDVLDIVPFGTVSATATWNATGVPYRILFFNNGVLDVSGDLTITAGVTLEFDENVGMRAINGGQLRATGTPAAPVLFTGTQKVRGYWRGLAAVGALIELDGVIIEYGGRPGGYAVTEPANLLGATAGQGTTRLRVRNSILRESLHHGLFTRGVLVDLEEFENNTLTANGSTPAYVAVRHVADLTPSSTFTGNGDDRVSVSTLNNAFNALDDNAVFEDLGVPYWFVIEGGNGTFFVRSRTLTLQPGVEMQFARDSRLASVEGGGFVAVGSQQAPIRISGAGGEKWHGLGFLGGSSGAVEHFDISDGGAAAWNITTRPANITIIENSFLNVERPASGANADYGIAFDHTGSATECTVFGPVWVPPGLPVRDLYPCFGPGGSGL